MRIAQPLWTLALVAATLAPSAPARAQQAADESTPPAASAPTPADTEANADRDARAAGEADRAGSMAGAPTLSASGALGAGMLHDNAAAALDLGVDVAGEHYVMGLGARLRWLVSTSPDGGFRSADWDERSEWAGLLRYLGYARDHDGTRVALAMGELGGVGLGHGSLIDGYSAGLHADHRHLGAELRVDQTNLHGAALIDDLVAPRIVGGRAGWGAPGEYMTWSTGASSAVDLSAQTVASPTSPSIPGDPMSPGTEVVALVALDGRLELATRDRQHGGALSLDLVALGTMGAGTHLGLSGHATAFGQVRLALRTELRAGTDHYIASWFGPLYELDRRVQAMSPTMPMAERESQLDRARRGGLGGLGTLVEAQASVPGVGEFALYHARRSGLPDHLVARAVVPFLRDVQGAAWLATEVGQDADTWILATELRLRIRSRWFASAELSRLYTEREQALTAIYSGLVTAGMTVDL